MAKHSRRRLIGRGDNPEASTSLVLQDASDARDATPSDTVQAALAAMAIRVESLTGSTNAFRTLVTDRLTDYSEHAMQLVATSTNNLDEYRQHNERALSELRRGVFDASDAIRKLLAAWGETASAVEAIRQDAQRMTSLVYEREQRTTESIERLAGRIEELGGGVMSGALERTEALMAELTSEVTALRRRVALRVQTGQLDPEQIEAIAEAVVDAAGRAVDGDGTTS